MVTVKFSAHGATRLQSAVDYFFYDSEPCEITLHGKGNINDTWLVNQSNNRQWLLQRLNPHVFHRPDLVLANMRLVINHLVAEGAKTGIVPDYLEVFRLKISPTGVDHFIDQDGCWWRAISFIPHTTTYRILAHAGQAEEIGRGLGRFHGLLSTLPVTRLSDTLPGFHDTANYLDLYDALVKKSPVGTNKEETFCADFVEQRRRDLPAALGDKGDGLSWQVTHNDPKVANFLFSADGKKVVSLVDLDTVKPGLILHDLGDGLRSCCSMGREDFGGKGSIFDPNFFRSFLEGYHREFGLRLTDEDQNRIVAATHLITFELGLRFFSDHLAGNVYFKTDYPDHNLKRGLALFHQAAQVESIRTQLDDIVADIFSGRSIPN